VKLLRRTLLTFAAAVAAAAAFPRLAAAEDYPTRPVRIIAGFAAGGGVDVTARLIGQWLGERLGQSFVIENRTGAGGNIGTEAVVNAAPDGYTLLLASVPNAVNATLYDKLNFNFMRDTTPVAGIIRVPMVMLLNPSVPATTVSEFIAYAKANPEKVNMASAGKGSAPHMAGELFKMMASINLVHVPYRGQGPALSDLLGGQVQVLFAATPGTVDYIATGRLRALAVTSASRAQVLPDLPPVGNFVPGYEASQWYGVSAPKNTPAEIVAKLNRRYRRSSDEGPLRRDRRRAAAGLIGRVRPADRRGNREVGQGGPRRGDQAGVTCPVARHERSEMRGRSLQTRKTRGRCAGPGYSPFPLPAKST
jgi:tripartite-type tricarboxylate transporter receptor subunit TctC